MANAVSRTLSAAFLVSTFSLTALAHDPAPATLCPDNGSNDLYFNTGSQDHTVNINPNSNSDSSYQVRVYNSSGQLVGEPIPINDTNAHSFSVPVGGKLNLTDPQDGDSKKVEGAWTVT